MGIGTSRVIIYLIMRAFSLYTGSECMRLFEVAELINLPFEEKTVILYKNKKQALSINSNIR